MRNIPNFENFDVNEAIVAAGFGMNSIQNFGLGGGTPQTGYSMGAIAGTVGTSAAAIGNQANEYEMNENDDHTAQGYITEAKKHVNESIDKAYESCKESINLTEYSKQHIEKMLKGKSKEDGYKMYDFALDNDNPNLAKEILKYLTIMNESFELTEGDKHEFNPNETAERLKRREQQNVVRYRAAQDREDNYGIEYYKYKIAIDKIDLQKLKLMTQIHQLKQKHKK